MLHRRGSAWIGEYNIGLEGVVDHVIRTHDTLTPILASMPLQLVAYPIAGRRAQRISWADR